MIGGLHRLRALFHQGALKGTPDWKFGTRTVPGPPARRRCRPQCAAFLPISTSPVLLMAAKASPSPSEYTSSGGYKILRPDFVFLSRLSDETVFADLVDPYGTPLSDALPKICGLAQYATAHANAIRRIEASQRSMTSLGFSISPRELYAMPSLRPKSP